MKNLKKISRKDLKKMVGGKRYLANMDSEGCADFCTPSNGSGGDGCGQYGLTCWAFECSPGKLGFRCM